MKKQKHVAKSEPKPNADTIFVYAPKPEALKVHLAGDFNNWIAMPMTRENGRFQARMQLAPGGYQYKFVVDGVWVHDPDAGAQVPNPFGTVNSVIRV